VRPTIPVVIIILASLLCASVLVGMGKLDPSVMSHLLLLIVGGAIGAFAPAGRGNGQSLFPPPAARPVLPPSFEEERPTSKARRRPL